MLPNFKNGLATATNDVNVTIVFFVPSDKPSNFLAHFSICIATLLIIGKTLFDIDAKEDLMLRIVCSACLDVLPYIVLVVNSTVFAVLLTDSSALNIAKTASSPKSSNFVPKSSIPI